MHVVAGPEVAHKDVILSVLGASAGLAGLILVFLGIVISGYQSYPADTPKKVKERAQDAVWPVVWVFVLGILTTAIAALWLIIPGGDTFYWACVVVFMADLLAIVVLAVKTTADLMD
jgi:hypothetical protein